MITIGGSETKIVTVLSIFCILQAFYFYATDAQIISKVMPSCVFGVDTVSYDLFNRHHTYGIKVKENDTSIPLDGKKVSFLVHGFLSEANNSNYYELTNAWLDKEKINILSLNWSEAACDGFSITDVLAYGSAVNNVPAVAQKLAEYIVKLSNSTNIPIEEISIIGHSLGAHVAGFAAKALKRYTGKRPYRIIGLDPAGLLYENNNCSRRICKTDAECVEIFHTSLVGIHKPIGHIDFYYNGGMLQPRCILTTCSHSRAVDYLTQTIISPCYIGTRWNVGSYSVPASTDCNSNICAIPGLRACEERARGTFYVRTGSSAPYCSPQK